MVLMDVLLVRNKCLLILVLCACARPGYECQRPRTEARLEMARTEAVTTYHELS